MLLKSYVYVFMNIWLKYINVYYLRSIIKKNDFQENCDFYEFAQLSFDCVRIWINICLKCQTITYY